MSINDNAQHLANVAASSADTSPPSASLSIDLNFTWQNTLRILLAVHQDGNAEGRRVITREFERMALAADLSTEAISLLDRLVKHGLSDPAALQLLDKARRAVEPQPARLAPRESEADTNGRFGLLARQYMGRNIEIEVCYSAAGFYIGTYDEGEPCSRESQEYWPTRESATKALDTGTWTQRVRP